jgi:hypothetical protein
MSNLRYLSLANNQLTGPIPSGIGNLTNLTELYLDKNHLTGGIPSTFGNLSSINWLYLHDNQLSGELPPEMGNLTSLQYLGLALNQFSGDIPSAFTGMTGLVKAYVDYNMLTATDPAVKTFLNLVDPGWDQNQTIIPSGLDSAFTASTFTLTLGWQPIPYTWDDGYYEVECDNGVATYTTSTNDKTAFSAEFVGLPVGVYDCMVRTVTLPTNNNQNTLITAFSPPVVGNVTAQNTPPNDKRNKPLVIDNEPVQFYQANFNQSTSDGSDPVPPADCAPDFNAATAKSVHYEIPPVSGVLAQGGRDLNGMTRAGGPGFFPGGYGVMSAGGPGFYGGFQAADTDTADTVIGLYRVNADSSLTLIACNDEGPNAVGGSSLLIFERDETVTYHVIVWAKDNPEKVIVEIAQTYLTNPGFDVDTNRDKLPDGWKVKNPDAMKVKCKAEIAFDPPCMLQIKGNGLKSKLKQKLSDVSDFTVDHEISLEGFIDRKKLDDSGTMQFKLTYEDTSLGDNGKVKLTYNIPEGTSNGYEQMVTPSLLLEGNLSKAIVQISYSGIGGRIRLDDIRVINTTQSSDAPADPPEVPDDDPTE